MKRIKPLYRYVALTVLILLLVFLWSLPLLVEYYVEKNDTEWLGREIEMADLDMNLFTGRVIIYDGVMFEKDSRDPFLAFNRLEINLAMLSLPSSLYEVEYFMVESPQIKIIQNGQAFNFDDLLFFISEDSAVSEPINEPIKYTAYDLQVVNGSLIYNDLRIESELTIENSSITIASIDYLLPEFTYTVHMNQKEGGEVNISGRLNWEEMENFNSIQIKDWTLKPYQNYLNSFLNISHFNGYIDADLQFGGNFSDSGYVATSGQASISNFVLADAQGDSLMRWDKAMMDVDTVHTSQKLYNIRTASIDKPEVLFKYFEATDSFSQLYVGEASETLDTVQVSQREIVFDNPFQYVSDYLAYFVDEGVLNSFRSDSAMVRNGRIVFQDFSRLEDAVIMIEDISATTGQINPSDSSINFTLQSTINQTGRTYGELNVDRTNLSNFQFDLNVEDFYISAFDPYSKHFTAFPIWEGELNVTSKSSVRDNHLISETRLLIMQPEVGKKLDIDTEYNIPLRFAFGLLKDVEGNVDLTLPIEGDLDDPDYKVGPIILKVFMNILSKAVASPYKFLARTFDADEDDLKAIRFGLDQDSLAAPQEKSLNLLARVLDNKEDLQIRLEYLLNEKEEKDAIALQSAKRQYVDQLPDSISSIYKSATAVDNTDSLFVVFLNNETGGLGTMSVAEMSRGMLGEDVLNERVQYLRTKHKEDVAFYLFDTKGIQPDRVEIQEITDPDQIASVIRPTFMIVFDAMEYSGDEAIGPAAPEELIAQPPPPETDNE